MVGCAAIYFERFLHHSSTYLSNCTVPHHRRLKVWETWRSWIHASWYNYENNQQDALYRLIYYSTSALHVSGDVYAYCQEHLTVFTASGSVHASCCWQVSEWVETELCRLWGVYWSVGWLVASSASNQPTNQQIHLTIYTIQFQLIRDTSRQQLGWTLPDAVNTVKCAWRWAKTSPETHRADLE